MKLERIGRTARPRPAFQKESEYARTPQEAQELENWFVGCVDDLVDESAKFIDGELQHQGLNSQQREEATRRIQYAVVSVWVQRSLYLVDLAIPQSTIDGYLERKFGIPRPERPQLFWSPTAGRIQP